MVAYKLRIEMVDIEPAVVRTVVVPGFASFADLHSVIQSVMQWEECEYHAFSVGFEFDADAEDEAYTAIADYKGKEIEYIYGPDAAWDLLIAWCGEVDDLDGFTPELLEWEGNAPPEGCLDMEDFRRFEAAAADPGSPDREEYADMFEGWEFDPEVARNSLQVWGVQGVASPGDVVLDPMVRMTVVMMTSALTGLQVVFDTRESMSKFVMDPEMVAEEMPDRVSPEEMAEDPGRYVWIQEDPYTDFMELADGFSRRMHGKPLPEGEEDPEAVMESILADPGDEDAWDGYVLGKMSDRTFLWARENGYRFAMLGYPGEGDAF